MTLIQNVVKAGSPRDQSHKEEKKKEGLNHLLDVKGEGGATDKDEARVVGEEGRVGDTKHHHLCAEHECQERSDWNAKVLRTANLRVFQEEGGMDEGWGRTGSSSDEVQSMTLRTL